jgi:hypothetical protein
MLQIGKRICIKFVLQQNLLNKTQGLAFLGWNLYERYPMVVNLQNSKYAVLFLDSKIVSKEPSGLFFGKNYLTKLNLNLKLNLS